MVLGCAAGQSYQRIDMSLEIKHFLVKFLHHVNFSIFKFFQNHRLLSHGYFNLHSFSLLLIHQTIQLFKMLLFLNQFLL